MPFRLIVGPYGSGKTARVLETFKRFSPSEHRSSVRLIVPSVAHVIRLRKLLLSDDAFHGIFGDPICTVDRFASEIAGATPLTDGATRRSFLRDALHSARADTFAPVRDLHGFLPELERTITLLRESGISPDDLVSAVEQAVGLPQFSRRKLTDLAEVYQSYSSNLSDSSDSQALICHAARSGLSGSIGHVLIHGFTGFSHAERELLKMLTAHCEITITLEHDSRFPDSAHTLEFLSSLPGVSVEHMDIRYPESALGHLQCHLFASGVRHEPDESVQAFSARDPRTRAEMVAREIKRLMREDGVAHSDIALVTRNLRDHGRIARILGEYHIPIAREFLPLADSPLAQRVLNRAPLTSVLEVEAILRDAPLPGENRLTDHYAAWRSILRIAHGITSSGEEFGHMLADGIGSGVYRLPGEMDGISLLTAYSLDGLSFDSVFIIGVSDGTFPTAPFDDSLINHQERERLNPHLPRPLPTREDARVREMRLFHRVVCSARSRLYLCGDSEPSEFIQSINALFTPELPVRRRGAGEIIPSIAEAETADELLARTMLDCCAADAAPAYNLLLDAGMIPQGAFDWAEREYTDAPPAARAEED